MKSLLLLILLLSGLTLAAAGCGQAADPGFPPTEPPAAAMMPLLPGYNTVEGEPLIDYLGTLAEGSALLAGRPELAATIGAVDQIIGCYQSVGAIRARVYSDEAEPLSAGTVAIADREMLTDPQTLFRCLLPPSIAQSQQLAIKPCLHSYTLAKDDNEFYILYAGTTAEICSAFCTALEGCDGR